MNKNSMPENSTNTLRFSIATILISLLQLVPAYSQQKNTNVPAPQVATTLTRTTSRNVVKRLGYGSSVTLLGPPSGSITIEGWNKNEVDITAEIVLHANSEADLDLLALVNTFMVEKEGNRVRILTAGMHDKKYMKKAAKDFPKALLGMPWKINYVIHVPQTCDLDIQAGRGPVTISKVDGLISLNAVETQAEITLTGGILMATIAGGKVNFNVPARSWRGRGAEIRLALGELNVQLPPGFSADINADILRTGKIENNYASLVPRDEDAPVVPRAIRGRTGAGGAVLIFTVGDGTINIRSSDK